MVDAKPPGAGKRDERASAIAAAARRMLEQLGVWEKIAADAQPILSMEITDSRTGDAVRPVFLTFDGSVSEGEPFAHMVPNEPLVGGAARGGARGRGGAHRAGRGDDVSRRTGGIGIGLGSGATRRAGCSSPPTASARGSAPSPASTR